MRLFVICILIHLISSYTFAQTRAIDSLLTYVSEHVKKSDTNLLNTYLALSWEYAEVDKQKASEFASLAKQLAIKLRSTRGLGMAYYRSSFVKSFDRNYSEAIVDLNTADSIFRMNNYIKELALTKLRKGRILNAMGEYKVSISVLKESVTLLDKINNNVDKVKAIISIGANYYMLSDYINANQNYLNALQYLEQIKDTNSIITCITTLGLIKNQQSRYDDAIKYYNKAIKLCKASKNDLLLAKTYSSLGNTYDNKKDLKNAFSNYNIALSIQEKIKDTQNMALTYANIGIAATDNKDYAIAFPNLLKGHEFLLHAKDTRNASVCNAKLGLCILNAPDSLLKKYNIPLSQRYTIVEKKMQSSISALQELDDIHSELLVWQGLATVYSKQGRYQLAYEAMIKADTLKDKVLSTDKNEELLKQQMDYEHEKESAVAATLHKEALNREKIRRKYSLAGIGFLALGALSVLYFINRRREAIEQKRNAELSIKVLRLQMNPHFIFNSLNSISDYLRKNNKDAADDYLSKFSKAMRMTLEHSEEKLISLADEIAFLELYLQLEARRTEDKFNYAIYIDEQIDVEEMLVPPLMLQPFVENSIWHGITQKEGKGNINIQIKEQNGLLYCIIEDDGLGLSSNTNTATNITTKKSSLGMKITKARIELLNKQNKIPSNMTIKNKPNQKGVSVTLTLPNNLS